MDLTRLFALVGASLVVFLTAGCAEENGDAADGAELGDGRESRGGRSDVEQELREVSLYMSDIQILVSGAERYEVEIPNGTASLFIVYDPILVGTVALDLSADVDGCGTWREGARGGNVQHRGEICNDPTPGGHVLTVSTQTGIVEGTIELFGRLP